MSMAVESLERRLDALERKVLGPPYERTSKSGEALPVGGAAGELSRLAKRLGNAVEARGDRLAPVLRRASEIDALMAPEALPENALLSAEAKADLALSQEALLRQTTELGQRLKAASSALDHQEAFASSEALEPRLAAARLAADEQSELAVALTREAVSLLSSYNSAVEEMTATFVKADAAIKKMERNESDC